MFRWIRKKLDDRLYEWAFAVPSVALSLQIAVWPEMTKISAFQLVDDVVGHRTLTQLVFVVGCARLFALAINGYSDIIGPITRSVCAFMSALLWAQFSYALLVSGIERGMPSPELGFWISFTLAEIFVSYRAMMDVRRVA